MDEEVEVQMPGGVKVPAAFKARWDELVSSNRELKASLQEMKGDLRERDAELKEARAAQADPEELTKAQARIAELEGQITSSEFQNVLTAEGLDPEDSDTVEYLQHKWEKSADKDGKKASFKDFFNGIKDANPVIKAAKAAKAETADTETEAAAPATPKAPKAGATGTGTEKATPAAPKVTATTRPATKAPSSTDTVAAMDAAGLSAMPMESFKGNRADIRRKMFGS